MRARDVGGGGGGGVRGTDHMGPMTPVHKPASLPAAVTDTASNKTKVDFKSIYNEIRMTIHERLRYHIQSDLVYPNNLVPIKMCSDCETCGLLNHCK